MTLPSPKVVAKDEDRISNLPDEILHDILSCLPTKDAVGTCVLSKRWQFVWTHISGIDLEDDSNNNDPLQLERTMLFVDKLLSCRDVNINKVCLHFREGADLLGVYMWICSAIVRKVEELCINITVENVVLPRCIFTCESLTVLKLAMECIVKPPNAVFLPNLKILHLTSAKFSDDSSSQKLFCSFPVLEELSLTDCIWDNIRCISIVIPTLKTLMIDYNRMLFTIEDEFLNCEIKIRAERVVVFNCSGTLGINIIVSNLPLLEDATISLMPLNVEEEEEAARGINLLAGIHDVRSLTMLEYAVTLLSTFVGYHNRLPVFVNLTHLELKEMEFDDCTGESLMIFLRHSPNLLSLVFAVELDNSEMFIIEDWMLAPVPQCLNLHLKQFCIHCFGGRKMEIQLVELFLQHAAVLQKMDIRCSKYLKKRREVMDQLQRLPRSSADCKIVFAPSL